MTNISSTMMYPNSLLWFDIGRFPYRKHWWQNCKKKKKKTLIYYCSVDCLVSSSLSVSLFMTKLGSVGPMSYRSTGTSPIIMGCRVRLWVLDSQGACVTNKKTLVQMELFFQHSIHLIEKSNSFRKCKINVTEMTNSGLLWIGSYVLWTVIILNWIISGSY